MNQTTFPLLKKINDSSIMEQRATLITQGEKDERIAARRRQKNEDAEVYRGP